MGNHNHIETEDHQCASGKLVLDERLAFEKRLQAELPGNPGMAFVGIGIALVVFVMLALLPWVMDFMQNEGIIRPRIHLRNIAPPMLQYAQQESLQQYEQHHGWSHARTHAMPAVAPAPLQETQESSSGGPERFGAPRNY